MSLSSSIVRVLLAGSLSASEQGAGWFTAAAVDGEAGNHSSCRSLNGSVGLSPFKSLTLSLTRSLPVRNVKIEYKLQANMNMFSEMEKATGESKQIKCEKQDSPY